MAFKKIDGIVDKALGTADTGLPEKYKYEDEVIHAMDQVARRAVQLTVEVAIECTNEFGCSCRSLVRQITTA